MRSHCWFNQINDLQFSLNDDILYHFDDTCLILLIFWPHILKLKSSCSKYCFTWSVLVDKMNQNCDKWWDKGEPLFLTLGFLSVINGIGFEISFFILCFNDHGFGCIHHWRFACFILKIYELFYIVFGKGLLGECFPPQYKYSYWNDDHDKDSASSSAQYLQIILHVI